MSHMVRNFCICRVDVHKVAGHIKISKKRTEIFLVD